MDLTIHTTILLGFMFAAPPAQAAWTSSDLPYRDYLDEPVTAIATAGSSDLWAVSRYAYPVQGTEQTRWNSMAWRSLNGALLWDLPWDAPNAAVPGSHPFQDVALMAASFADRDTGVLFGRQRPYPDPGTPPGPYVFLRTTNRGRSWTTTTLPVGAAGVPEEPGFALDTEGGRAWAAQGRRIFEMSEDALWSERAGAFPRIYALRARGLPAPRVAGEDGGLAVTGILTSSGFQSDLAVPGSFRAVAFSGPDTGWVAGFAGDDGVIYGTEDGGAAWTLRLSVPGTRFLGLAVGDADRLWAVGERTGLPDDDPRPRGVIYGSRDGGRMWNLERLLPKPAVSAVARGPHEAWAGCSDGVYRYVPDNAPLPADTDRNGHVSATEIVRLLRRAGGLEEADHQSVGALGGTADLPGIVAALRRATALSSPLPSEPGSRAVVLYNTTTPDANGNGMGDGEEVARYYALQRGVPESHLLAITWADTGGFGASTAPRGNWADAYGAVILPLREKLEELGPETVDTLVFTFGMPFSVAVTAPDGTRETIMLDAAAQDPFAADAENWSSLNPYAATTGPAPERYGESLFGARGRPMGQAVMDAAGVVSRGPYYLAGRVDGPDVETCLAMVDNALFAERYHGPDGYQGVAYNDNRAGHYNAPALKPYTLETLRDWTPAYQSYPTYDKSIARSILSFADRGYPWRDEVTYVSIGENGARYRDGSSATSAPRAMFYAGWYNYARYFNVFEWLPGSVGCDFDSASAAYFREGRFFAGGALAAGLTALVGVRDEPYSYHPKPDVLMEYLARGYRLGEAAALATDTPRLARHLVIGDPLFRPFAGSGEPVPVPSLGWTVKTAPAGWRVTLESDIPVRASLRYRDGEDPDTAGSSVTGEPTFYARRHTFTVPALEDGRAIIIAEDATGRTTSTPVIPLP